MKLNKVSQLLLITGLLATGPLLQAAARSSTTPKPTPSSAPTQTASSILPQIATEKLPIIQKYVNAIQDALAQDKFTDADQLLKAAVQETGYDESIIINARVAYGPFDNPEKEVTIFQSIAHENIPDEVKVLRRDSISDGLRFHEQLHLFG